MTNVELTAETLALPRLAGRRSLAEAVHHALREAITHGTLSPGARLREVELGKRFGVSPTPVREALRRLEREGLVQVTPHRGAAVVSSTPAEIAHLYEIHELLESHATRRAAESGTRDIAALVTLLADAEAVLDVPDQRAFNRIDLQFHRRLNELGGNAPLAELIEQTHRRIQAVRIRHDVQLPDRPRRSHAQHRALLAAVHDGDPDRAEALARDHIRAVRDSVVHTLRQGTGAHGEEVTAMAPASRRTDDT